jgi:hypothetical protein
MVAEAAVGRAVEAPAPAENQLDPQDLPLTSLDFHEDSYQLDLEERSTDGLGLREKPLGRVSKKHS